MVAHRSRKRLRGLVEALCQPRLAAILFPLRLLSHVFLICLDRNTYQKYFKAQFHQTLYQMLYKKACSSSITYFYLLFLSILKRSPSPLPDAPSRPLSIAKKKSTTPHSCGSLPRSSFHPRISYFSHNLPVRKSPLIYCPSQRHYFLGQLSIKNRKLFPSAAQF